MSNLFPMFLKLDGKRCLVVGAGRVGEPKIGGLIDTGARLHVSPWRPQPRSMNGQGQARSRSNSAPSPRKI